MDRRGGTSAHQASALRVIHSRTLITPKKRDRLVARALRHSAVRSAVGMPTVGGCGMAGLSDFCLLQG